MNIFADDWCLMIDRSIGEILNRTLGFPLPEGDGPYLMVGKFSGSTAEEQAKAAAEELRNLIRPENHLSEVAWAWDGEQFAFERQKLIDSGNS